METVGWKAVLLRVEKLVFRCEVCIVVPVTLSMILVAFGQVVGRYFLNYAPAWCEELSRYLFIWLVFIGAPIGVREKGHMALKIVVDRLPRSGQRACHLGIYGVAVLFLIVLTWHGAAMVIRTVHQVSPTLEISYLRHRCHSNQCAVAPVSARGWRTCWPQGSLFSFANRQ